MIHPPDPANPRQTMHVAMKVSIMTDGPGGLQFSQAVQTGCYNGFSAQNAAAGLLPPALIYNNNDPDAVGMIAWQPSFDSAQVQTDDHRRPLSPAADDGVPIVTTPSTDSLQNNNGRPASSARNYSPDKVKKKENHDHPHRHHKSHHRSKNGHKSGSIKSTSTRPDEECHIQSSSVDSRTLDDDTVSEIDYKRFLASDFVRNLDEPIYSTVPEDDDFGRAGDRVIISTFSDDKAPPPSFVRQSTTEQQQVINKETTFKQSLRVKGADSHVMKLCENLCKSRTTRDDEGRVTTVEEMEIQEPNLGPLLPLDNVVQDSRSVPDIVAALMEPIIKLSEQLSANKGLLNPELLGPDEESNLVIKTTINAHRKKLCKNENREPAAHSVPFETLINDVGLESKEIQTDPQKYDISTSTYGLITKQKSNDQSVGTVATPKREVPTQIDNIPLVTRQVQTQQEKVSSGTNTELPDAGPIFDTDLFEKLLTRKEIDPATNYYPIETHFETVNKEITVVEPQPPKVAPRNLKPGNFVVLKPNKDDERPLPDPTGQQPVSDGFSEQDTLPKGHHPTRPRPPTRSAGLPSVEIFQILTKNPDLCKYGLQSCLDYDDDDDQPAYESPGAAILLPKRDLYPLMELPESPRSNRSAESKRSSTKSKLSHQREEQPEPKCSDLSSRSINSERSSLSGINPGGAFNVFDLRSCTEENSQDYMQGQTISYGMDELEASDNSTTTSTETLSRNSTSSNASLKADDDQEEPDVEPSYDKLTRSVFAAGEKSFHEILRLKAVEGVAREDHPASSSPADVDSMKKRQRSVEYKSDSSTSTLSSVGNYASRKSSFVREADVVRVVEDMGHLQPICADKSDAIPIRIDWKLTCDTSKPEPIKNFKQTSL